MNRWAHALIVAALLGSVAAPGSAPAHAPAGSPRPAHTKEAPVIANLRALAQLLTDDTADEDVSRLVGPIPSGRSWVRLVRSPAPWLKEAAVQFGTEGTFTDKLRRLTLRLAEPVRIAALAAELGPPGPLAPEACDDAFLTFPPVTGSGPFRVTVRARIPVGADPARATTDHVALTRGTDSEPAADLDRRGPPPAPPLDELAPVVRVVAELMSFLADDVDLAALEARLGPVVARDPDAATVYLQPTAAWMKPDRVEVRLDPESGRPAEVVLAPVEEPRSQDLRTAFALVPQPMPDSTRLFVVHPRRPEGTWDVRLTVATPRGGGKTRMIFSRRPRVAPCPRPQPR